MARSGQRPEGLRKGAILAAVLGFACTGALAVEQCGICATSVVTNSSLAGCFLEKFGDLAKESGAAVAVDLSDCPGDRGIVDALPTPGQPETEEPDTLFLLTRAQLECLKSKLQEPGVVLDPQARIDLGSCG